MRIGIDARMLSHEIINAKINSIIVYPPQNLVDLIWTNQPLKCEAPVFKQEIAYRGTVIANVRYFFYSNCISGQDTRQKLEKIRSWIRKQRLSQPTYANGPPMQAQKHVGTLISFLPSIGKSSSE